MQEWSREQKFVKNHKDHSHLHGDAIIITNSPPSPGAK